MYNFANLFLLPTAKITNKTFFFVHTLHLLTFQPNDTLFHALIFSRSRWKTFLVRFFLISFTFSLFTRVFLLYQKMPELKIERCRANLCLRFFPPFLPLTGRRRWFTLVGLLSNTARRRYSGTMNQKDLQRSDDVEKKSLRDHQHLREPNRGPSQVANERSLSADWQNGRVFLSAEKLVVLLKR